MAQMQDLTPDLFLLQPFHQMRLTHAISPQTDALMQALRNPKCTPEL